MRARESEPPPFIRWPLVPRTCTLVTVVTLPWSPLVIACARAHAVRAQIEKLCDVVARGDAPRGRVVAHAIQMFAAKFAYFTNNLAGVEALFDAVFDERPEGDKAERPFARDGPTAPLARPCSMHGIT